MGRISDEDIQRVRDATDAVALISESVVLQKKGRLYWGCCPFHGEKTPSFKVDPATGLWHCFGCGAGGDAFGFLMRRENIEFPDAVRLLADRARIEIVETGGTGTGRGERERLNAALDAAADFYSQQLLQSRDAGAAKAREYLARRGFGSEVAKRWGLGWSPGRGALVRHLSGLGFSESELIGANLALKSDDGRLRDRFYERVMFPIHDLAGKAVGFGGRVIGTGEPKYLNTGETPVFHKSENLYAIDVSKNEIVKAKAAIVVEGYTDVIALHEAGVSNAVATLGTALTRKHVKLLGRFAPTIYYLFDADEAGLRAAERAAEFIDVAIAPGGDTAIDLRVAVVPDGLDPADFVARHGGEALGGVLESAMPLMQFVLQRRMAPFDLANPEERMKALGAVAPVLAYVKDSLLGKDYVNRVADLLSVDYQTVQKVVLETRPGFLPQTAEESGGERKQAPAGPLTPAARAERALVGLVAAYPELRGRARELLTGGLLSDARAMALLGSVLDAKDAVGEELVAALGGPESDAGVLLAEVMPDLADDQDPERVTRELLSKVKEFALERQIIQGKARMRALDSIKERDEFDELFKEIAALQVRLDKLRRGEAEGFDQEAWG